MSPSGHHQKIVFFDGTCVLCNGFVDYLMRLDSAHLLHFASLQGETARKLLPVMKTPDSVVFYDQGVTYFESSAVLKLLALVSPRWAIMNRILLLIPEFFRNILYRVIAANRYRLFGKRPACRIPEASDAGRILP